MKEPDSWQELRSQIEDLDRNAKRYRALKAWLIARGNFAEVAPSESEPFVLGDRLFGATFDAAVDTLPIPEEPTSIPRT